MLFYGPFNCAGLSPLSNYRLLDFSIFEASCLDPRVSL
jgi:hypothetical protein